MLRGKLVRVEVFEREIAKGKNAARIVGGMYGDCEYRLRDNLR